MPLVTHVGGFPEPLEAVEVPYPPNRYRLIQGRAVPGLL